MILRFGGTVPLLQPEGDDGDHFEVVDVYINSNMVSLSIWVAGPTGLYCIFLTMPCFFVCLSWVRQLNHQFPFVEIQLGCLPKELTTLVGQGRAGRAGPAGPM